MKKFLYGLISLCIMGMSLQAMELEEAQLFSRFMDAVRRNNTQQALFYLERGAPINGIDQTGQSAWEYAVSFGTAGQDLRNMLTQRNIFSAPPLEPDQPLAQANEPQIAVPQVAQPMAVPNAPHVSLAPAPSIQSEPAAQAPGWASWLKRGLSGLAKGGKMFLAVATKGAVHYGTSLEWRKKIAQPDSHSHELARVETSIAKVSDQEAHFVQRRKTAGRDALQAFVGDALVITDKDSISVGSCFSGGGVRATLETLGWLKGAEKIGFLPLTQYAAGLSGSTWALNPWVASGMPLKQFTQKLLSRLTKSLLTYVKSMTREDLKRVLVVIARRMYNQQSVGPVDLFGILLSDLFLRDIVDRPHECTLSSLSSSLLEGNYPFIISTAVLNGADGKSLCEFSPFAIGSHELGSFIPTWAFGRVFKNGQSSIVQPLNLFKGEELLAKGVIDIASKLSAKVKEKSSSLKAGVERLATEPEDDDDAVENQSLYYGRELTLSYLMGIWGSAFAVDTYSVLHEFKKRLTSGDLSDESLHESVNQMQANVIELITKKCFELLGTAPEKLATLQDFLKNDHFGAASIANFAHNPSIAQRETLSIVDGGFYRVDNKQLNIAIMPLLRRDLNLITICDSSIALEGAPSLRAAEALARRLNLKFPQITYEGIDTRVASMFIDEQDIDAPIIVYMPGIKNSAYDALFDPVTASFTSTTNFTYTQEQSEQLMGLLEFNVKESKEVLRQAVIKAIERKRDRDQNWIKRLALKIWNESRPAK